MDLGQLVELVDSEDATTIDELDLSPGSATEDEQDELVSESEVL